MLDGQYKGDLFTRVVGLLVHGALEVVIVIGGDFAIS